MPGLTTRLRSSAPATGRLGSCPVDSLVPKTAECSVCGRWTRTAPALPQPRLAQGDRGGRMGQARALPDGEGEGDLTTALLQVLAGASTNSRPSADLLVE